MKIILFTLTLFLSNLIAAETIHDAEYQRALANQMKEQPLEQARLGAESLALQHDAEYQKALANQQAEQTKEQVNQQHFLGVEASSLNCATVVQGKCNAGYVDITHGNTKYWACGKDCPGGIYLTDGVCNCACRKKEDVCPTKVDCHGRQGKCNAGYQLKIPLNQVKHWACGKNCTGGKYATDGVCNCACIPNTQCNCYPKGPCNAGYMDKTNGHYKYWACGDKCVGGKHYTDGVCNCACVPNHDNVCPVVGATPLWSKLGFQAQSMITENTKTTMFALGGGLLGITGIMLQVRKWTSSNDAQYELLNTDV